jgi:hypothetical protein
VKKVTISEKTQVYEYVCEVNPETTFPRYTESHNASLEERMNALEHINSDLSIKVYELNQRLSNRSRDESSDDQNKYLGNILEEYRKAILELISERENLLLHISMTKSDVSVESRPIKRMKSSPNISLNPKLDNNYQLQNNSIYSSPGCVESESYEEFSITSSKDCNNLLLQFDATRNVNFTEIKRPLIFKSLNSWTYIDKRITVSLLPRKIKQ